MKRFLYAAVLAGAVLAVAAFARVMAVNATSEVDGLRADVTSSPERPRAAQETTYTLRLVDRTGAPLGGAKVMLRGRMGDGMTVLAPLRPSAGAGIYRGRVLFRMEGRWELTLRVTANGKSFELPLSEPVGR